MKTLFRKLGFVVVLVMAAAMAGGLGMLSVVVYQVFWGDYSQLEKSTILARINEETTLYASDDETAIGSFFDNAHRSYVSIEKIPAHMIRAMVASEDQNFYHHFGVDPVAISGAFVEGMMNGMRFRRGGSTITQQTVKNIMGNWENSFRRKFQEMIRALQLERMYSKNEILEFYLNQFHVTANGNGIGIASRYYFNKAVEDLSLVEAAFIAGSVKAPSKYNPFTKYTKAARSKAWQRANERKNYVLRRMYSQGWIDREELQQAWEQEVPFKRGSFTTREVALVSLIRGQLNKKEVLEALHLNTVDEMNQAGFKIFTTIDAGLQNQAQLVSRRNLSRLEFALSGFKTEDPKRYRPLRNLDVNEFYFGKVSAIKTGKEPHIELDFGLPIGVIPAEALQRTAKVLNLATYKGEAHHLKEILNSVKVGDVLLTEVKEYNKDTHKAVLELRRYPAINGGLIAVDKGEVRAVVAGFEARGFNRAMFATRQPGSVFKSVIYAAALQLGWDITDQVENERRVFPFQGHLYFPRPDHASPYPNTSILWSGVKSENIASIYLAAHLVDKMNFGQFKQLLGHMSLLPQQGESVADFHYRVSKETGVQLNSAGIREHLMGRAIADMKPDFVFSGRHDLFKHLNKLWWGQGYLRELETLHAADDEDVGDFELPQRVQLLKINLQRYTQLAEFLNEDWALVKSRVAELGPEVALTDPVLGPVLARFRVVATSGSSPSLAYSRMTPDEESFLAKEHKRVYTPIPEPGRSLNGIDVQMIWGSSGFMGEQAGIFLEDVLVDGVVPLRYIGQINSEIDLRYDAVMAEVDTYGLYRYFNHHDFRIALGLNYVVRMAKAMGVYNQLEPVLSFPLGTNVVSVAEVAKIYQTFATGQTFRFYKNGPQNQLNFIKRIEDRQGNIIYQPEVKSFQLLDKCIAEQMGEILRKVVTHGTGRRARGELQLEIPSDQDEKEPIKIRVPAYGKTGTTNDYTTAYFAGFIPYPKVAREPLSQENSMVIASYVGYDFNKMMKRGPFKVTGAHGALPVWSDFGRQLLEQMAYVDAVDKLDLTLMKKRVWPLAASSCGRVTTVDLPRGIVTGNHGDEQYEVFDSTDIERDGESITDEFAATASVKSTVVVRDRPRGEDMSNMLELFALPTANDSDVSDAISAENDGDFDGGRGGSIEIGDGPADEGGSQVVGNQQQGPQQARRSDGLGGRGKQGTSKEEDLNQEGVW